MDSEVIRFQYMYFDNVLADIEYNGKSAKVLNHTTNVLFKPFGVRDKITSADVEELFKERCFPETRANAKRILKDTQFGFYDPYLLVRETNGVLYEDKFWIRFEDRMHLTWKDVSKILDM